MIFQRKYDQAMDLLKEKNDEQEEDIKDKVMEHDVEETNSDSDVFEKHDRLAMTLSAFMVFIPVALIVLGIFALVAWLFVSL